MKVVFLQDVPNVAKAGDVKEVADGYSRNFLLPKKLAVAATTAEIKKLELERQADARRQIRSDQEAEALAQVLKDTTVVIKVRAGSKERLYGSVTSSDIAREIKRLTRQEIDKRKIELVNPIRQLGSYQASIKLTKDITATVNIVVEQKTVQEKGKE